MLPKRTAIRGHAYICAICKQSFWTKRSQPRVYCSKQCQYKATAIRKTQPDSRITTTCPHCSKEFWYYRSWPRKYCSNVCKGKANIGNISHFAPSQRTANCERCGEAFQYTPGGNRGRFCSLPCFGRWQSANIVGDTHPLKGHKFGRAKHLPPPLKVTCDICGTVVTIKPKEAAKRRFCSRECANKGQIGQRTGADCPSWRGGHVPYYGPSWRPVQRVVRERDRVCVDCGKAPTKRALDVHHLIPFRSFGVERHEEANEPANLVALCNACHHTRHVERARNQRMNSEPEQSTLL